MVWVWKLMESVLHSILIYSLSFTAFVPVIVLVTVVTDASALAFRYAIYGSCGGAAIVALFLRGRLRPNRIRWSPHPPPPSCEECGELLGGSTDSCPFCGEPAGDWEDLTS